ncbi:Inosine-uridine preferring nucleoside hydrolase [Rosistilla oblonga]|uniref:nucleoside hydrolase n=1 Tax=Rosistilla oblonga TaxID=2527990 RepID=UPI00118BD266|nr:Inosine-uridine preferring nucleoside hydrolase [Rosistilla oblonga]
MFDCFRCAAVTLMLAWTVALPALAAGDERRPVPLIFDTDIGNDVDDALALGMIHALQSRGECELLAVTITKDHPLAAPFADAVNTFYGRGEIPIGVCRSGKTPEPGRFTQLAKQKDGQRLRYPHDLLSGDDAPDAVSVLRETLAAAEDHSVVIAQVGFSTNLANLLKSKPDQASPLDGEALVKQKVRLLSLMAGAFPKPAEAVGRLKNHKGYNIIKDIPSAQTVAHHWPTPLLWSGYEIGISLPYPHQSIQQDYGYVPHHPLSEAYVAFLPPPHNRPTWDLTSVLQVVRPNRNYFGISQPGSVAVADDGSTQFTPSPDGRHRYLTLTEDQKLRVIETLVLLSSEPPQR